MSRIAVLGDSGVGKTSWLFAMNGKVPLNVFASRRTELFIYKDTQPHVEFVAVLASVSNAELFNACKGCDGVIILYRPTQLPMHWLRRLNRLFCLSVPTLLCCHGSTVKHEDARLDLLLQQYPGVQRAHTSLENPHLIIDCVNRIITQSRKTLASPLGDD